MVTATDIDRSIKALNNPDHAIHEHARYTLIGARHEALPRLIKLLKNDKPRVRWEAVYLLKKIGDPSAADALVDALADDNIDVHWLASEALISLGYYSIMPLLKGMIRHFESYTFLQGAYHVLHTFERFSTLDPETQSVLDALRGAVPGIKAAWAAERAIEALEIFRKK